MRVSFFLTGALFGEWTPHAGRGAVIGLIGVVGVLASPLDLFWQAAVGFAAALVLWITAAVIARQSWALSRSGL